VAGGLTCYEFDSARRAARVAAAGVELIDVRVFFERQDKALAFGNGERTDAFNSELWHG
jgi:hypothetical protein